MEIKPKLRFFDLTMIIVSMVIGVGIFKTPVTVAQKAGTPFIFFLAWTLGGLVSICGALTFAEIGSRFPAAGGFYKIFSHCFHPAFAFMLNWSLVIINAGSAVSVAIVGADYINPVLLPASLQNNTGKNITALSVIIILYVLNYLGIKMGARTQNLLSLVKIALILLFCFAIFGSHPHPVSVSLPAEQSFSNIIKIIGVSFISVFFTYGGYQNTINFGADIQNPQKNIPRSIFAGMSIVILLYLAINFAYFTVLGFSGMQHSTRLAADLARSFLGNAGDTITSVAIFVSVCGFINTSMMSNPRVYYAMSEDKILPGIFKKVNSKTMVQEFTLTFFVSIMILSLFVLGTFEKIVNYVMFIDSLSLISAAATLFIFRKRAAESGEKDATIYRVKFFPLIPLLFMSVMFAVTVSVAISDPHSALYGAIIFLAGFPLYKIMTKAVNY